jgi:hypothetical protein
METVSGGPVIHSKLDAGTLRGDGMGDAEIADGVGKRWR